MICAAAIAGLKSQCSSLVCSTTHSMTLPSKDWQLNCAVFWRSFPRYVPPPFDSQVCKQHVMFPSVISPLFCHPALFCLSILLYSAFLLSLLFFFFSPLLWTIFSFLFGEAVTPACFCSLSHWQVLSWLIWQTGSTRPLHAEFPWTPGTQT